MQISNTNQVYSSKDPEWVLLSELSFIDFLSDQDRKKEPEVSSLFQTLRKLGMLTEGIENIAKTVSGFAEDERVRTKQSTLEFLGRVRIFCQKKMMDDASSVKLYSRPSLTGGWGYFTIERGEGFRPDSSGIQHKHIDLYLYKEGG